MKFRAHYADGSAVDINSDTKENATAHAVQLEEQEAARAAALDPPLKYTKRSLREVEALEADDLDLDEPAEPTGSRRRKK